MTCKPTYEELEQRVQQLERIISEWNSSGKKDCQNFDLQKKVEFALHWSEERFSLAMEANKDGLWDWDLRSGEVYYSPGYAAMLGYTSNEIPPHCDSWTDLIHPDDKEFAITANNDCIENRCSDFQIEFRMQAKNGEWRWILGRGKVVVRDENGLALRMIGTHTDITEHKGIEESLREAEWKFNALFENGPLGVAYHRMIYDSFGKAIDYYFIDANEKYIEFTGVDPRGKLVTEAFPGIECDPFDWIGTFGRVAKIGKTIRFQQYLETNNRWYDCVGFQYRQDHFVAAFLEITDQKRAEEELRISERRFRFLFERSNDAIFLVDTSTGQYLDANVAAERLTGRPVSELTTLTTHSITPVGAKERLGQVASADGTLDLGETTYVRPDGSTRTALLTVVPLGEKLSYGIAHDITERKRAEEALRESEERFRALHNATLGGVVIHDQGFILECNKGLSDITGYDYGELIGTDLFTLVSGDTRDAVIENIKTGNEKPYEVRGVRKNGEMYPLRLEARGIPYKGKNVRVAEFKDITETKRVEREKADLERQLRQAQKMDAVGRLAGGVAHDFNNMLSVIIGHAGMALRGLDPSQPCYSALMEIKQAGERSANLTRQLLAFARKQTVAPRVLDLNETVERMLKLLRRLIGENINLVWLPDKNIDPIRIDPSQIDQILANLCVNARDAITGDGRLTIETGNVSFDDAYCADHDGFRPGDYVMLSVSDDGSGIDKETLSNIFEPFFTTKTIGEGTGLGLATVYGVVKQNNGFVNVYSEPDLGTTIKIYLPPHLAKMSDSPEKKRAQLPKRGNETILLVEDEPAILRMATTMLESFGYSVLAARTPSEALRQSREYEGDIHMLVTDVIMPEMNGRDLALKIVMDYPALKQLFMSGYTANVIAQHGVLDDDVNFIHKPFSSQDLGAKVREVFDVDE